MGAAANAWHLVHSSDRGVIQSSPEARGNRWSRLSPGAALDEPSITCATWVVLAGGPSGAATVGVPFLGLGHFTSSVELRMNSSMRQSALEVSWADAAPGRAISLAPQPQQHRICDPRGHPMGLNVGTSRPHLYVTQLRHSRPFPGTRGMPLFKRRDPERAASARDATSPRTEFVQQKRDTSGLGIKRAPPRWCRRRDRDSLLRPLIFRSPRRAAACPPWGSGC